MAKEWTVEIHVRGVNEVFRQSGVVDKLGDMGRKIAAEASALTNEQYPNNGYEMSHYGSDLYTTTHGTTGVFVHPNTNLGREAQARHNVLTKAMNAARG